MARVNEGSHSFTCHLGEDEKLSYHLCITTRAAVLQQLLLFKALENNMYC